MDVFVGLVPGLLGELGLLGAGLEVEVLGGVVLVEDELVVDDPEPLGREGTVGVETVGGGRVGVETVGVETVGGGRFGVETVGVVSAEADGSAAMPTTASTVIAPATSFRLRNTVVNLLPRVVGAATTGDAI